MVAFVIVLMTWEVAEGNHLVRWPLSNNLALLGLFPAQLSGAFITGLTLVYQHFERSSLSDQICPNLSKNAHTWSAKEGDFVVIG